MNQKPIVLVRYHDRAGVNTRLPSSLNKVQGVLPPLNHVILAASLRAKGFPVEIIDCQESNISKEKFELMIKKKKPSYVCIGPFMTPALEGVFEACKICKKHNIVVIVGGPHLSIYPKETVMNKNIDFGFIGEADEALPELIDCLINKKDYSNIQGLIWKKGNDIFFNDAAIMDDLNKLPLPAYDLLPMKNYNSIIGHHPTITMMIGRGCPYHCGFCYKTPSDKKIRFREVDLILKEMELLVKKYKTREIMFYDDTLTLSKDYIMNLCNAIKKAGLKVFWEAPTRVNNLDEELIKKMASAGCIRLRMGIESGDEKIREKMKKGITNKQIFDAFKWCKKHNIETFAYFIIGYIGETRKTMNRTIKFAIKLDPDFCMFTTATPLPDTPLFEEAVSKGLIDKNYWREYTLGKNVGRIPFMVPDADKYTKKAYLRFYFRPKFILKKLSRVKNLDTIKKYFRAFKGLSSL